MTEPRLARGSRSGAESNQGRGAVALSPPARHLHLAVLTAFAQTGRAPSRAELDRIARSERADPGVVLAELAGRDMLVLDGSGEVRAAYPFSPSPTQIQVHWERGPRVYAMCAIDALGISAMLDRPVTITAREPGTGRPVTVEVDRTEARWRPRSAVVFSGAVGDAVAESRAVDRCCGFINFFTSARSARAWARAHPEVTGTVLRRDGALRWGIEEFGTLMHRLT